jgi:hypothetical protein
MLTVPCNVDGGGLLEGSAFVWWVRPEPSAPPAVDAEPVPAAVELVPA